MRIGDLRAVRSDLSETFVGLLATDPGRSEYRIPTELAASFGSTTVWNRAMTILCCPIPGGEEPSRPRER